MVKIVCDFSLPGEGLPGWVVRGKPYSHTHTKILQTLSDLYMLLALYCCALVSDLPLNKQKIADLVSELKISYFFSQSPQLGSRLVLFFPLCLKKLLLPYLPAGFCPEAPQTHLYLADQSPECLELSFLSKAKKSLSCRLQLKDDRRGRAN